MPVTVSFTDLSANAPTSWSWDFGDGGTSTEQNPTHQYVLPGHRTISLTATNEGGSDTEIKHWYVLVSYIDVPLDYWAMREIVACYDANQVVVGYPDLTYRPLLSLTRDQMAVFIARAMAGGDANVPTGPATATFPDVPADQWAYKYIEYCYDFDVVQGYWDGYRPGDVMTRDQMAVYVQRAFELPM